MSRIDDRVAITRIVRERPEQLHDFDVIAKDGAAGRVASKKAQHELADRHLAVHVGGILGIFGKDVAIEADAIEAIDPVAREIHVDRIGDWVTSSPKVSNL